MILGNTKERTRFLRFAAVGASGAVVDFGVLNLLTLVFHVNFVAASVVSFIMAVINNFIWNRLWTYPDSRSKTVTHQLIQFSLINVIGLIIRTPLLAFLEKILINLFTHTIPVSFVTPTFAGHNIALAIAILVVMLWNYIANRYWTYNDVKE